MNCRIITEGEADRLILDCLLEAVLPKQEFQTLSAGGRSSAVSLARSVLATQPHNVALVVDADTFDPTEVAVRKRRINEALGEVADPARFLVTIVVPEVEALLFPTADLASQVFGRQISPAEYNEILKHPQQALNASLPGQETYFSRLQRLLARVDAKALSAAPTIQMVSTFIKSGHTSETALAAG
jgi:hypothetical protein